MNPIVAYLLGVLTIVLGIVPFWYMSTRDGETGEIYQQIFCRTSF